MQGFHVKLTINAEGSQGADVKHKVFWVTGCVPGPTTTAPTTTIAPMTTVAPTTTIATTTTTTTPSSTCDLPFTDTQCGLKGFRRQAARELFGRARVNGFAFDVEGLLLARRLGLPVAEVPVRAQARFGSRVRVLADGCRMLGEVWSVRRDLLSDHRSQGRAYA